MKQSRYNSYLLLESGEFLLYNSFHDKKAIIDEEMRISLTNGVIEDKDLEITLVDSGFLVGDTVDELKMVRGKRREAIARNFAEKVGVTFVLTYSCNLSCTYCYEQGVRSRGGFMNTTVIDAIMKFARRQIERKHSAKFFFSRLYGGEPLLNWKGCQHILTHIENMVDEYSIENFTSLITNATLFTDPMWEIFSSFGLEKLQITLDGCKEDHNKRRIMPDGSGTYDMIMKAIGRAFDMGIIPEIRVNLDEENYRSIESLFDDLKENGFEKAKIQLGFIKGLQMHCSSNPTSCLKPTILAELLPYIWEQAGNRGLEVLESTNNAIFCQFDLLDFYVIDPFLDVYKCWDLIGMKEHRIGKIVDSQFFPEYAYFDSISRDVTLFNGCRECDILPVCNGGCAARAYDCFGTYHAAGCFQERYVVEQRLKRHIIQER